jgi:endonuclease/exonuclease/phosphatase family metal-dependent hydrolase
MTLLRVMTYNIFMGGRKGAAVHDVVRGAAPDVLLVNESPKTPLLWRRKCKRLAAHWRLSYVTGGRSAGSNMIAVGSRVSVKHSESRVLRQPLFQPRRGIASAQLRVEGRLVGVVACHLSLDRARRAVEVEQVLQTANRLRGVVIVAGDLNERPDGPSWQRLRQAGYRDHGSGDWKTFPADQPDRRIDALLVRGDAALLRHGHPSVDTRILTRASDHRPVLAELRI